MGQCLNKMLKWVFLFPLIVASTAAEVEDGPKKPKLFYVSTLSTTSTVSTLTVCYATSATLATCASGKRRKRRVEMDQPDQPILPTLTGAQHEEENMKEEDLTLEGGEEEEVVDNDSHLRKARFLVYWMTTTSVSTSLTYTTTLTVASLTCTPSSFALSKC